jgi:hypothetical protein
MSKSFKSDASTVRKISRRIFGHNQHPGGIWPDDREINRRLIESQEPLPDYLGIRQVRQWFAERGLDASEAYMNAVREEAIMQGMGEAQRAAKEKRPPRVIPAGLVAARIEARCQADEDNPDWRPHGWIDGWS